MSHLHDKIDFTVDAYIVHKDKVLLRYHEKYNNWYAAGGHIELDEDPVEAVLREAKEETGLEIKIVAEPAKDFGESRNLLLPIFMNRHRVNPGHEHVALIYAATSDTMELNPADGEINDAEQFRWLTAEEIESAEDIKPRVKLHALTALKKVQEQYQEQ